MDEPERSGPPDVPLGDVFSEVPLFREIQRVLLSSTGPVNWELARQVGIAVASWGTDDPSPTDEDRRGLEDAVRATELHVAEFTGMSPPPEVARVEAIRRGQWVEAAVRDLKDLVEPGAARMGEGLAEAARQESPEGMAEMAQMAGAMLGQLSPLLLGAQAGTVLGTLAQRAFGHLDVPLPRPHPSPVAFVSPNVARFEHDWSLDPMEFRAWVALHEMVHRFQFAGTWVGAHVLSLLRDYSAGLKFDLAGLRERLERLDPTDPQAMQGLLQSDEGLVGPVLDDEQRLKLARIQAFLAAAEGHGRHVVDALGPRILRSHAKIVEASRRREAGDADPLFERLLGVEMKPEQYLLGEEFCSRVSELTDEATLARMWESAEALPSQPELEEPRLWLARTA